MADMDLHCGFRNPERARDLSIGQALANQSKDFAFPAREFLARLALERTATEPEGISEGGIVR